MPQHSDGGIITFDSQIPDDILESLNNSYEQINFDNGTIDDDEKPTRPEHEKLYKASQAESSSPFKTQKSSLGVLFAAPLITLACLVLVVSILMLSCGRISGSELSSQPTSLESMKSTIDQIPSETLVSVNLASKSDGAYILKGYTTPPALSSWWPWSSRFKVDPDCMILPLSNKCWPLSSDSAIGIGFDKLSTLDYVKVRFSVPVDMTNRNMDDDEYISFVERIHVYGINSNGDIKKLGKSTAGRTKVEVEADFPYAQVVIRIKLADNIAFDACVRSIEVWGNWL